MQIIDKMQKNNIKNAGFPMLEGRVKVRLHNPTTGKTEIIEGKNLVTNAVKDIFDSNLGGIIDYDNLMPLYQKMFGGVLCFSSALDDTDATEYAIPSASDNAITAHAGQTTYADAADDLTRGNPNSTGLSLSSGSVTQVWEWASSQGNGTISAVALCHKDIGDAGATGRISNAFQSLDPFLDIACKSRTAPTEITGAVIFALKNNVAYSFKVTGAGILSIYKTPVICSKTKLQGNGLIPLTDYTETTTINLGHGLTLNGDNNVKFKFDLATNKLYLFTAYSDTTSPWSIRPVQLIIDTIDLSAGTATSSTQTLNLVDKYLWTMRYHSGGYRVFPYPLQAVVIGDYLYWETCTGTDGPAPDGYIRINLTNFTDIQDITDNTGITDSYVRSNMASCGVAVNGAKAITTSGLMFEGTNLYSMAVHSLRDWTKSFYYTSEGNIAAFDGLSAGSVNRAIMSKLYLATKYNLQSAVTKTAAQSMTVTYTLTEV